MIATDSQLSEIRSVLPWLNECPELSGKYNAFVQSLWGQPHISAATLELCRIRLAQIHACGSQMEMRTAAAIVSGLNESKIQALLDGQAHRHPLFTPQDRACLDFAEIYAQDPAAISDEMADEIIQHFGQSGLVCLTEALGIFDGMARLALMFEACEAT